MCETDEGPWKATHMDMPVDRRWLRLAILFGMVYLIVGLAFGELANLAASNEMRVMWRLAAWLLSAVAFAVHIGYEHFRFHNSPRSTALHASLGAAIGAFALAAAANVHALWAGQGNQLLLALALVLWPIITAVPAFLVALVIAAVLARMRRKSISNGL
jgi:vacuolar-type H+-ATPase subunit I/STV1